MSGEAQLADGRRVIGLYIPFETAGLQVREIVFEPCTFGHLLRWQEGKIAGTMALMCELADVKPHVIEAIRRPDDGRVMAAFLEHVHPEIATDIQNGVRPLPTGYGGAEAIMPATARPEAAADPFPDSFDPPSSAPDAFGGYEGFEATDERPVDYIPGLDGPP